jgi:hypothetical protein
VTVDRDDSGGSPRLASSAAVSLPALSLMTFVLGSPLGYSGMVKIGALNASAAAGSGPGASAPAVTGAPVAVQLWDTTTVIPGYKTLNVTPGAAPPVTDPTAHAAINVLGTSVVMDATVHWNKAVTSQTSSGGAITAAAASLTNWLFVDLHIVMTTLLGLPLADLNLHLDYGRVAATATYEAAP